MVKNHEECRYYLPCGWCDKKNEKCIFEQVCKAPDNKEPVADNLTNEPSLIEDHIEKQLTKGYYNNPTCNHEWICTGVDTGGWMYTCKKCLATRRENYQTFPPVNPVWINPEAPDINKVGDFPPYNEVTCNSRYINTNKCPEKYIEETLASNVTTSATTDLGIKYIDKVPGKKKK